MDKKAIAVIINDIHYNINTLEIADKVTRMAVDKANELGLPLIIAGDAHDTKANMRAECVNAMIETFKTYKVKGTRPAILRGNHDQINEKSVEHSLNFLEPMCWVIDKVSQVGASFAIPYQHDPDECRRILSQIPKNCILIMHQGLNSSNSGHYIQDRSAINPEDVAGRQVISGHYHTRQEIKLPGDGLWTYTGNPYTLNFGEANDPEKGFHVLYEDGYLKFIPTNVRRHKIVEYTLPNNPIFLSTYVGRNIRDTDMLWLKVSGTREELKSLNKEYFGSLLNRNDFKLDLIPLDSETKAPQVQLNQSETLDVLIDSLTNTSDDQKQRLKQLWKDLK